MKITKENAKAAIERFNCVVLQDYPKIENLCAVESETKTSVELYAYSRDALGPLLQMGRCPHTRGQMKPETLMPAANLFGLVLAAVEFAGHLDAVKNDEEYTDFKAFTERPDFTSALTQGRTLLTALMAAPGANLKEKIEFLELPDLRGSAGQMNLLERTLGFDLNDFTNYREPGQAAPQAAVVARDDEDMDRAILASLDSNRQELRARDEEKVAFERAIEASNEEAMLRQRLRAEQERREQRRAEREMQQALEEEKVCVESLLAEQRRKARAEVRRLFDEAAFQEACKLSVRIVVPAEPKPAPVNPPVEVKHQQEIPPRSREELEADALKAQKALDFSMEIQDERGILLALAEQERISKALAALPVRVVVSAPVATIAQEQAKERTRLQLAAKATQQLLNQALEKGDQIAVLSALQQQTDIERALAALTLNPNAPANGSAMVLSAIRVPGLGANNAASSQSSVLPRELPSP